jgi:hypothetical protein
MKNLEKDWLTSQPIDFEYKKYLILAYLQSARKQFEKVELYPTLADLVSHYTQLLNLQQKQESMKQNFPTKLSTADLENWQLIYKKLEENNETILEIEDIINFAIPQIKEGLNEGKKIYEYIEKNIQVLPIGLLGLHNYIGFLIIYKEKEKEAQVFEYKISIFENANEIYRGIHTNFLENIQKNTSNTFESLKQNLVKKYGYIHSSTYLAYSKVNCSLDFTLLPVVKRLLVKEIKPLL